MGSKSARDLDIAKFLEDPNQWPNYNGYVPLSEERSEIRVLGVFFGPNTRDICASITHTSFRKERGEYEALSYYWGPPDKLKPIWIGGQEVHIRASLHSFLFVLCEAGQKLPVWLDALCINQRDAEERNWQVRSMGEIYAVAKCTNVWLGESNCDSEYSFSYLQHRNDARLKTSPYRQYVQQRATETFRNVLQRSYWSRLWIVQEVSLAKRVIVWCGQRRIRWGDFIQGVKELESRNEDLKEHMKPVLALAASREDMMVRQKPSRGCSEVLSIRLIDRISQFGVHECVDPRDKMYGLQSLSDDGKYLEVNYRKNLAEVLFEVALLSQSLQEHKQGLQILVRCEETAAFIWRFLQPQLSKGLFAQFFTTNFSTKKSEFEQSLRLIPSRSFTLASWAGDWATRFKNNPCRYLYRSDVPFNLSDLCMTQKTLLVPTNFDHLFSTDDVSFDVERSEQGDGSLPGVKSFTLRLETDPDPHLRIVNCIVQKQWFPLVVKHHIPHRHWTQKQVQICHRILLFSRKPLLMQYHYGRDFMLLKIGLACIQPNDSEIFFVQQYQPENDKIPLLNTCDCKPDRLSLQEVENFRRIMKSSNMLRKPDFAYVRHAIEIRQNYHADESISL